MDIQRFAEIFNAHYLGKYSLVPGGRSAYDLRNADGGRLATVRTIQRGEGDAQIPKSDILKIFNTLGQPDTFPFKGALPLSIEQLTEAFDAARIINAVTAYEGGQKITLNTEAGTFVHEIFIGARDDDPDDDLRDGDPDGDLAVNNIAQAEALELSARFSDSTAIPAEALDELADAVAAALPPGRKWVAPKERLRPRVEGRLIGQMRSGNRVPIEGIDRAIEAHGKGVNPGSRLTAEYVPADHSIANNAGVAGTYFLNIGAGATREIVIYQDPSSPNRYTDFNGAHVAILTVSELSDAAGVRKAKEEVFGFKSGEKVQASFEDWRRRQEEEGL